MRFNDRSMALLGVPDLPTEAFKHAGDRRIKPQGGGGGGGKPTETTSTNYQTNIPEYAKPYVETMLGATQKQLFQGTPTGDGGFDITGFQPYKAYGGTYDANGNQTSYDPSKGIAGFQPMQTRAQEGVANMQVPGQYNQAMGITGQGIMGQLGTAGQGVGLTGMGYEAANAGNQYAQQATNPYAMQAYMSPYMQNVVDIQQREAQRKADIATTGRNAQAVQAGAFGGSRQAITDAEAARNLALQQGDIQATGLQSAFQNAQQAQQYGANLGLQGMQAGMQGVGAGINAQQAAYNQAMQGGNQLATLGGQQLAAQQGIYGLQNQYGAQQQAQQQQILNQAQQDYANAQQYPLMQLGTMSNMIRGLPMQASTTQQYQAQPSLLTQGLGAIGAGTSLYNAFNPPAKAKGGIISYDVGGEVESDLESANDEYLQKQLKESSSPSVKRMAQRILRERQMEGGPRMAGGGIVAFAKGDKVIGPEDSPEARQAAGILMAPRPTGAVSDNPVTPPAASGIAQDAPILPNPRESGIAQAAVQAPAEPQVEDTLNNLPSFYKALYNKANATAGKTRQEIAGELEKEVGPNVGAQEQRAKLMAERANAEDEAHRNRWLRAAEFFSRWGSTPGSTLVAGLKTISESVPTIVADEKAAKDIRMKIDNSIGELDQAARLEKKGYTEKAEAIKEKEAANMMKVHEYLSKAQEDQVRIAAENKKQADYLIGQAQIHRDDALAHAASQKEVAEIHGKFQKEVANIQGAFGVRQAGVHATVQKEGYAMQERGHDQRAVDALFGEERKALADIDRVKRDPDVAMSMKIIEMAKNPSNNISPDQLAMANKAINEKLGDAPSRLEGIRAERQRVQNRLAGKNPSDAPTNDPLGVR